jgi:hypothetical protein
MTSDKQLEANRLNAQHSTGPRSDEGKAASRFNALKHGLDAKSHIIPGEDAAHFETLAEEYFAQFQPAGPAEEMLVRVIVESDWFSRRYARIEAAVIDKLLRDTNPADLYATLNAKTNPLHHIFRRRDAAKRDWFRALKELQKLQKDRKAAQAKATKEEAMKNGFVPSKPPQPSSEPAPAQVPPIKKAS